MFATPARVFNVDGTTSLTGAQWQAQLWDVRNALSPVALTPIVGFGAGNLAGTFAPSASVVVANALPGTAVALRVVVWDSTGGATYATAGIRGNSSNFTVAVADSLAPSQPILIGMNSFAVVPEPSVIALAMIGAGAFVLRRRKKA